MTKVILTLEDDTTYTINCENIEVSAFASWYDTGRKYNDSINLNKVHHEEDVELILRQVIDALGDKVVTEASWYENDKEILSLSGNISSSWSLQANPTLTETINFMME